MHKNEIGVKITTFFVNMQIFVSFFFTNFAPEIE